MALATVPIELDEANAFVASFHRHNRTVRGHRFSIGASDGAQLVGVAIVGRPISRLQQAEGATAEVLRCCEVNGAPKGACSFLYAACWRAWRAMGGQRLITYTLQTESGASLRGAGWTVLHEIGERTTGWNNRPGSDWQPMIGQAKFCWIAT